MQNQPNKSGTTTSGNKSANQHKGSTPNSKLLTIPRRFNVPVEKLFEAFKTSDAIKAWWWPKDLYTDKVTWNFREGGDFFINMKWANKKGDEGGMGGSFVEIKPNELIVMTDYFADAQGNRITAAEAKQKGMWPETVYITFDFESRGETSGFTMSQEGIPNELQAECTQGWSQSFDKLEKYLSGVKN